MYEELKPMIREQQAALRNTTNIFKEVELMKNIKDLAVEDFDTLDEVIQSLWHQSRREKQIVIEGQDSLIKRYYKRIGRTYECYAKSKNYWSY